MDTLDLQVSDRVANLTLDRPEKLNAISEKTLLELRQVLAELDEREDVHVVVLRGAGDKAFCAGMDLDWSEELTKKDRVEQGRLGEKTITMLEQLSVPVVAAVHGYALGGGLELALGADFIIARDDAQLGLVEITLSAEPPYRPKATEDGDPDQPEFGGSAPGWGGVKRLPARVGTALAKEMLFTGIRVPADRALRMGLVNNVFPADEFDDEVAELGRRIGAMNRYNLRLVKELVNKGYDWIEPHPQ